MPPDSSIPSTYGTATCGGSFVRDTGDPYTVVDATPNTGGGGSSVELEPESYGASGVIVVRWKTASASAVTFTTNGHGATVPNQEVATGTTAVEPVDPSAAGFIFNGWYTDSALTTAANFATPIAADTTLYASWSVLASTGVNINPLAIPGAVGALMLGMMLMLLARRRRLHP